MDLHKIGNKKIILSCIGIVSAVVICFFIIQYRENKLIDGNTTLVMSKETRLNALNDLAKRYFYEGNYEEAIKKYNILFEKDENNPFWLTKVAEVCSVDGNIDKSEEYLNKAKEIENLDEETFNNIIFTEYMNGNYDVALVDGEVAINKYPQSKSIVKTMYVIYMANNQIEKAKKIVQTYPVDDNSAYDISEYARMLMIIDEKSKGYEMLRKAWDIDKDEYKIYDVLAQISVYNKDILLQEISALSEKNPDDIAYKMWLAKIYSISEETSDIALKILDDIKGKDVGSIEIKLIEAYSLQNINKNEEADTLINEIISTNENDYRVYHTAAWYYLGKGDTENALKYCEKSIDINANYPDNYGFLMPEILKKMGNSKIGKPYFRTSLMMEPYNYNIMIKIADYWYNLGDFTKALKYFNFAQIVNPNDAEIKYSIVSIYLQNKMEYLINSFKHREDGQEELANKEEKLAVEEEEKAIKLLKECNKLTEDDLVPKYHRTLGTIYMEQGKSEEAIEEIRFAYHADEADVKNLNNAGCYYIMIDDNLERGHYNLLKAYEGLNDSLDQYVIDTITENYQKADELIHKYYDGEDNEIIKIPDFNLFY